MSIVFPILFFLLSLGGLIAFKFLKVKDVLKLVILGLTTGSLIASFVFALLFGFETFSQDNQARLVWAIISLYIVLISIVMFVYTFKMHKAFGISFLAAILIFGVVFLVIGFAFGRSALENERVVSSTASIILLLR